ncbi:MAG: TrbI/VirB10 family protein [Acidobacteria bacterium]|nr:TrbI/VirB10 family protein [Acidobacteriota bacterium]
MSRWKQWIKEPKGALPGGIITKAGIALIGVLIAGMLFSSSLTGPEEDPMAPAPFEAQAVDDRAGRSFEGRLRAEAERQVQRAAADDARADRERRQAEAEMAGAGGGSRAGGGERGAAGAGDEAVGMVQAEYELREALRLEEIERRTRSLRSLPVSRTYRDPNEARDPTRTSAVEPEAPEAALDAMLASFGQSVAVLEAEMQAGMAAEGLLPGSPKAAPQGTRVPGTAEPSLSVRPLDPPGWERIREGSFLEAVLLTQLSGEFPGPVLAMVSVPLYSADRQRVLVPRGARVVGTARAVQDRDQSRLAVAFHRLLMPDGSWIDLEFRGLNQAGEGALKDRVSRHYFSTFAAAGAVGALSGLTLAGASPYGLRAGVGQGLGGSATSVLDRFLNRMPEITIRAGHRLRIWLTADALIPTPDPHQ